MSKTGQKQARLQARDFLVLRYQDLSQEVSKLFDALNDDPSLRTAFFSNPNWVMRSKLSIFEGAPISDNRDEVANRILFSALSNDKFLEHLDSYGDRKSKAVARLLENPEDEKAIAELDPLKARLELADAIFKYGDRELVAAVLEANEIEADQSWVLTLVSFVFFIVSVKVLVNMVVKVGLTADTGSPKAATSGSELRHIAEQLVSVAKEARDSRKLDR